MLKLKLSESAVEVVVGDTEKFNVITSTDYFSHILDTIIDTIIWYTHVRVHVQCPKS